MAAQRQDLRSRIDYVNTRWSIYAALSRKRGIDTGGLKLTLEGAVVRAATPEDAAEVRRLSISFTPAAQEVPPEAFHSRFNQFLAEAAWCLPVAQARGRLIGYGLAQDFGPGLRATYTTGRIHDLFVDPDTRLGGTGRALMNFIFDWSRARPQPMILDWQASPSAIGFYEALGFTADHVGDFPEYPVFTLDHRGGQRVR